MRILTQLTVALVGAAALAGCSEDASTSTAPVRRGVAAGSIVAAVDKSVEKDKGDATIVSATGDIAARGRPVSRPARLPESERQGPATGQPPRDQLGRCTGGLHEQRSLSGQFLQRELAARRAVHDRRIGVPYQRQWVRRRESQLRRRIQYVQSNEAVRRSRKHDDRHSIRRRRF